LLPSSCVRSLRKSYPQFLTNPFKSSQVILRGTHLGPATKFSISFFNIVRQLRICWCGAPSLTRSCVCSFQILLGTASAGFRRSESHRTHEHILLSPFLRLPQHAELISCMYFPQEQGRPITPPGIVELSQPISKSKLLYDWRSVSQSVCQYVLVSGTPLGPMTRFLFFLYFAGQLLWSSSWGALSDEKTGL
jgi:hypothetical protein